MIEGAVTPRIIFTDRSHINSQLYYRHKIKIADSMNMKIAVRLGLLNPNPRSEIVLAKFMMFMIVLA